jgi:hypothetical protein
MTHFYDGFEKEAQSKGAFTAFKNMALSPFRRKGALVTGTNVTPKVSPVAALPKPAGKALPVPTNAPTAPIPPAPTMNKTSALNPVGPFAALRAKATHPFTTAKGKLGMGLVGAGALGYGGKKAMDVITDAPQQPQPDW